MIGEQYTIDYKLTLPESIAANAELFVNKHKAKPIFCQVREEDYDKSLTYPLKMIVVGRNLMKGIMWLGPIVIERTPKLTPRRRIPYGYRLKSKSGGNQAVAAGHDAQERKSGQAKSHR